MRVFDKYWFNIADKVKFKDTQPYLKNMLAELGLSWSDLDFAASIIDDTMTEKILKNFPRLKKYYHPAEIGEIGATICSYTENWFSGELFTDKSDYDDVFSLFSKIPRPLNISSGHILLNGVNWFGEESLPPVPYYDLEGRNVSRLTYYVCYYSNYIVQYRDFYDGLKRNQVSVCIETTAVPEPRDSSAILEKLIPYLGKPIETGRTCVFSKEEHQKYDDLAEKHSEYLSSFMENSLPVPEKQQYIARTLPPIPHLADIPTMKKAFAGTGFTHKKGNPGYLGEYDCRDSHGYLYRAYVQKLSDWRTFRVWLEISGHNFFAVGCTRMDYSMKEEGESLPILREFALLCAKIRDEYGDKLAQDFGDTPEWYYKY